MPYGPSDTEYCRQAAGFVDRLFKGTRVAQLPIEQRTHFELVINMTTSKALEVAVPQSLLRQARVVE